MSVEGERAEILEQMEWLGDQLEEAYAALRESEELAKFWAQNYKRLTSELGRIAREVDEPLPQRAPLHSLPAVEDPDPRVEAVAKVLYVKRYERNVALLPPWELYYREGQELFREHARAALAVLDLTL